jgi:hypothetical protein
VTGAVAHSSSPATLQPDLTERIAAALANARNEPRSGFPEAFSYRELAQIAYKLREQEPTKAQLSAVRRSVARLVRDGRAERERSRSGGSWERSHYRTARRGHRYLSPNPGGVRRAMTAADHEAREDATRPFREAFEARRRATPYPVDTGHGGVVSLLVEPVLVIREHGVELRESRGPQSDGEPT